jgi:hypothetical protein
MFTDGFSSYPNSLKAIINEIDERVLFGATYDLCPDFAFKGESIAVFQLHDFDFSLTKAVLQQKGFTIIIWRNTLPTIQELKQVVDKSCQLWIISTSQKLLNTTFK